MITLSLKVREYKSLLSFFFTILSRVNNRQNKSNQNVDDVSVLVGKSHTKRVKIEE